MTARNKRAGPRPSEVIRRDSVGLYSRALQHGDELLEEARELQAAGKIREARAVERRARQVGRLIGALEREIGIAAQEPDAPVN